MSNDLSAHDLLPPEAGLELLGCEKSEGYWVVRAQGLTGSVCPCCGTRSSSRHSRYWRRLTDLPIQGQPVKLYLRVSRWRWRCRSAECRQRIFPERLPNTLVPWGRRTERVQDMMMIIGYRVGGRSAEFLMQRLALRVNGDTVLRALKRTVKPSERPLHVVGVDDWAWKRGQSYGTVLVDLERREVADLLPHRSSEQLADWSKRHPEVEVVTRDRYGLYAGGALRGAPRLGKLRTGFIGTVSILGFGRTTVTI